MRNYLFAGLLLCSVYSWGQEKTTSAKGQEDKVKKELNGKAKNLTHKGNTLMGQSDFVQAEANYRRAISTDGQEPAAPFNLGTALYDKDNYLEAFGNFKQAAEVASTKEQRHKAFHNMGNVHMQDKAYEKAVESYKQALRNIPTDEETRYNLALAKELLKKQQQENQDKNKDKDKKDKDKDQQDKDKQKDQNNEGGDQDKQDQNKDNKDQEGDQKKEKEDQNKGDGDKKQEKNQKPKDKEDQKKKQQPRPNQLSKEQIQNLLKAMQNEEKKVQQKIDEKKIRGRKIKTEKDW